MLHCAVHTRLYTFPSMTILEQRNVNSKNGSFPKLADDSNLALMSFGDPFRQWKGPARFRPNPWSADAKRLKREILMGVSSGDRTYRRGFVPSKIRSVDSKAPDINTYDPSILRKPGDKPVGPHLVTLCDDAFHVQVKVRKDRFDVVTKVIEHRLPTNDLHPVMRLATSSHSSLPAAGKSFVR
jgi:hypothetical protein